MQNTAGKNKTRNTKVLQAAPKSRISRGKAMLTHRVVERQRKRERLERSAIGISFVSSTTVKGGERQ